MTVKKIHYCWFGNNPLSSEDMDCIESWKKFFPDYEIVRWDESNFDINICDYVREAYDAKKWAYVSDFARMFILYNNGGLYFDTDVKVVKSFDDILSEGPFMGRENYNPLIGVNPGIGLYLDKKMPIINEILNNYYEDHFIKEDGSFNYKTIVERVTEVLVGKGLTGENKIQKVAGLNIYPKEYFCPLDYKTGHLNRTENTHSIHLFNASWLDSKMKKRRLVSEKIRKIFPAFCSELVVRIYMIGSRNLELIFSGNVKLVLKKIRKRISYERK